VLGPFSNYHFPISNLTSLQYLSNQPQMPKRIHHRPLQHPPDRPRPRRLVLVLAHGTVLSGSCRQCFPLHRHRIVHKQLNPHRSETYGRGPPRAMRRRLVRQKERRAECRSIEFHRSVSITDRQHRRNPRSHSLPFVSQVVEEIHNRTRIIPESLFSPAVIPPALATWTPVW